MLEPAASVPAAVDPTMVEPSVVATVPAVKAPAEPFTQTKAWPSQGVGGSCTVSEVLAAVETSSPVVLVNAGLRVPVVEAVVIGLLPPRSWDGGMKIEGPPGPPWAATITSLPDRFRLVIG